MDRTFVKWEWWAGASKDFFTVGPYSTKEEAIKEAQKAGAVFEIQDNQGKWLTGLYVINAVRGQIECEMCGAREDWCDECRTYLSSDEVGIPFACDRESEIIYVDEEMETKYGPNICD